MRQADTDEFARLADGRAICLACLATLVPDTDAAQPIYRDVLSFFRAQCIPHQEVPPLMLVEFSALNEYKVREGKSGPLFAGGDSGASAATSALGTGMPMTHTRGVCLCEQYDTITVSAIRRDGRGALRADSSRSLLPRRRRHVDVTAILVLCGLPAVLTGAILAHELGHAWLRMSSIHHLPEQIEEGLCQLFSYLWLEAQTFQVCGCDPRRLCHLAMSVSSQAAAV
jgi:Protein DA1